MFILVLGSYAKNTSKVSHSAFQRKCAGWVLYSPGVITLRSAEEQGEPMLLGLRRWFKLL